MPAWTNYLLSLLVGFGFGSVPFGYLAGRVRGVDIRTRGSGNIGFTNVLRTIGPAWAVPVLALDVLKGLLPTAAASRIGLVPALAGAGAIIGHVFTPWLGFRGGKGVATTIGVAALLCWRALAAGLGVYAILLLSTGFVSLSSIVFGLALPILTRVLYPADLPLLVFAIVVTAIIVVRHVSNIRRLLKGAEPRLGIWLRLFRRARG